MLRRTDEQRELLKEDLKSYWKAFWYAIVVATCGWYYGIGLGTFNNYTPIWVEKNMKNVPAKEIENVAKSLNTWIVFFFFLGCTIACSFASLLVQRVGRYWSLIGNIVFGIVLTGLTIIGNIKALYAVRFLQGVSAYLWTTIAPLMLKEIFPSSIGKVAGQVFNTTVAVGILVGYSLGADIFKKFWQGPLLFPWITEVFRLIAFAAYYQMESPVWMASNKKSKESIKKNYKFLYSDAVADQLAQDRLDEVSTGKSSATVGLGEMLSDDYRLQFGLVLMLNILNQLTGMNIVTVFSTDILKEKKVNNAKEITNGLGIVGAIATTSTVLLIKFLSMRTLLIVGLFGQSLGLSLFLGGLAYANVTMIIGGLYFAMCAYCISLGGVLFNYNARVVPPSALSPPALVQWGIVCLLVFFDTSIKKALTLEGMFFVAQLSATIGGIIFIGYSVQVEGKSDEQIKLEFNNKRFMVN